MIVHPKTGEVIEDLASLDDGQLAELVVILERAYTDAREQYFGARQVMIGRMLDRGATLQLTDDWKLRLRKSTRVKDNKEARELLRQLVDEVPAEFKKRFGVEVTASVSVLKEIGKLGGQWAEKIEVLLDQSEYLVIEPRETDDEAAVSLNGGALIGG